MNPLTQRLDEYLAVRRRLGFKLEREGNLLPQFVAYLERANAAVVTTDLTLTWATQPQDAHPYWRRRRFDAVRGFARYLHAVDPVHEVPPAGLLPGQPHRATPYLYSKADVTDLLAAAGRLSGRLRAATYATYIGLLSVTGMRAGEAIALDCADVNWTEQLLTLRNTKFAKSREVVLHPSTVDALRAYDSRRSQVFPRPRTAAFFVSAVGTRLIYQNVHFTFHELVKRVGLEPHSAHCRPRPHDLRHTFAVDTLLGWYRGGVDVTQRMHLLSTYLGHSDPANTYWYLSSTPELFALAGERLQRRLGELP